MSSMMMKIAVAACGLVALNFHGCKSGEVNKEACKGLTPGNFDDRQECRQCIESNFDQAEFIKKFEKLHKDKATLSDVHKVLADVKKDLEKTETNCGADGYVMHQKNGWNAEMVKHGKPELKI